MTQKPLIAIDATSMPANPAGAAMYILNLARALAISDDAHRYVIYTRSHSTHLFDGLPSACEVVDTGKMSRERRQLWEQTGLPADLKRRGVALLHSPHHTAPLWRVPCPRVLTIHDVTFFLLPQRYPWLRRRYFQVMTRLAAARVDAVIVPSASVKKDALPFLKLKASEVDVIPEGVDGAFQPLDRVESARIARERYDLPEGYLLSLGTREPGKNRENIFLALNHLRGQGRDLHLAVVGQGGWGVDLEQETVGWLNLQDCVHFTGYVPQEDLPAIYNAASVFVFPSLHEGFGLPALEAMACGVPVVTSNTSSMPEVAGGAARLVNPRDPIAIAGSIADILDDPTLAMLMRNAGLEHAAELSWEAAARRTVAVYSRVLGESPS